MTNIFKLDQIVSKNKYKIDSLKGVLVCPGSKINSNMIVSTGGAYDREIIKTVNII